ncbi:MAG TPA: ABC transporter, partial [Synechococcus sp. UBA8638]|nr:ABC transporter [Synechococcus sp. UBA8638]
MVTLQPAPPRPLVSIAGLNHWFGRGDQRSQVLHDLHLTLNPGEMVVLTGPSG